MEGHELYLKEHENDLEKLLEFLNNNPPNTTDHTDDEFTGYIEYRKRCIEGLLDGETNDYKGKEEQEITQKLADDLLQAEK